jgi:general secretion pathway protein K
MYLYKKCQGGALLTALFIMTLIAIVATAMSARLQLDIYRTGASITYDKLYLASQTVTFWALSQLQEKTLPGPKGNNSQGLLKEYPSDKSLIDNQIQVSGSLYDLQTRFNLNNLVDKKFMPMMARLIHYSDPKLKEI